MKRKRLLPKRLRYALEYALLACWLSACRTMGLDRASAFGARVGTWLGPKLKAHRVAVSNLARALPELSDAERRDIVMRMWDNLGRNAAEFAYLSGDTLTARRSVEGLEHLPEDDQPVIFVSAHIGNWELSYPMAHERGIPVSLIYRHANNPAIERIVASLRARHASGMLPKGRQGSIRLMRALKNRQSLAMLIDQKMNEGIAVPFFGIPAMTAPAVADLSLRYGLPIIPARIIREEGAHFRGIIYPPLDVARTGDAQADILAILTRLNAMMETWVRETPEQWYWVHKRWPREVV